MFYWFVVYAVAFCCTVPMLFTAMFFLGGVPGQHFGRALPCASEFFVTMRLENVATRHGDFCGDRFFYTAYDQGLSSIDLETGACQRLAVNFPMKATLQVQAFGRRMWLYGWGDWYEVLGTDLKSSSRFYDYNDDSFSTYLLWKGQPGRIGTKANGCRVYSVDSDKFEVVGDLALPRRLKSERPKWTVGTASAFVHAVNQGDRVHLFLNREDRLFYRELIEPVAEWDPTFKRGTADDLAGWTFIGDRKLPTQFEGYAHNAGQVMGMLIDGDPALFVIKELTSESALGHIYRCNAGRWSDAQPVRFPIGSKSFRTCTTDDGQRSFILADTHLGALHVYAVEADQVRETNGAINVPISLIQRLSSRHLWGMFLANQVIQIIFGLAMAELMIFDKESPDTFGDQSVRIASLARRGFARAIDLALILATTFVFVWLLFQTFDWIAVAEVLNLRSTHPSVWIGVSLLVIIVLFFLSIVGGITALQGHLCTTPGKWLLGLKTVRTTLRPCGFARSLVREFLILFESGCLLCWTPGIIQIARSKHRQRFGDKIADTIVITAASLTPTATPESNAEPSRR